MFDVELFAAYASDWHQRVVAISNMIASVEFVRKYKLLNQLRQEKLKKREAFRQKFEQFQAVKKLCQEFQEDLPRLRDLIYDVS